MKLPKLGLRQALVLLYITRQEMDDGFSSAQINHVFGDGANAAIQALRGYKFIEPKQWANGRMVRTWQATELGYQYANQIEKAFDIATA